MVTIKEALDQVPNASPDDVSAIVTALAAKRFSASMTIDGPFQQLDRSTLCGYGLDDLQVAIVLSAQKQAGTTGIGRLPLEAFSYTQLANTWKAQSQVPVIRRTLIGLIDKDAFAQCWAEKGAQLEALQLFVRQCVSERSEFIGPYHDGGELVERITRVLLTEPGREPGRAYVFFNQAGGDEKTRPDVAWCGMSNTAEIDANMMYHHLKLALEYKTTAALDEGTPAVTNGTGQLISRAGAALRAQELSSFTLPGAVSDNFRLIPVIVKISASSPKHLMTTDSRLRLVKADAIGQLSTSSLEMCYPVDMHGTGFKELVHLCWVAAREEVMRAAAGPGEQSCLEDGSCVSVLPEEGSAAGNVARFQVLRKLAAPAASGCVYLAVPLYQGASSLPLLADDSRPRVVLKVAPAAELVAQARILHLPPEPWNQVLRETHVLCLMARSMEGHVVESLPKLLKHGLLGLESAAAGRCLQGSRVVVTELLGAPLVSRGQTELTVLHAAEAERLMWDIFEALAALQVLGIQHCDVHPRNLGKRATAAGAGSGGAGSFYLFDFGSAMTSAELAVDPTPRLPCSMLFSAVEVLLGAKPGPLADAVALIFSGLALAGVPLPWLGPASAGDILACVGSKVDFMSDPAGQLQAWEGLFSLELRQLSEDVMRCALDGLGGGRWLVDRLARTSRGVSSAALFLYPGVHDKREGSSLQ